MENLQQKDAIVATIQRQLIENRVDKIKVLIPNEVKEQLLRMEKEVLRIWKLDPVYTGSIILMIFEACTSSSLTVDFAEELITKHGESLSKKPFDKVIKKWMRQANRAKRRQGGTGLGQLVYGAIASNKSKDSTIRK